MSKHSMIGVPEEEGEREKEAENLLEEIIPEKFPDLGKEQTSTFKKAHRVPNNMNLRRSTL